jgi:hypothetical protein
VQVLRPAVFLIASITLGSSTATANELLISGEVDLVGFWGTAESALTYVGLTDSAGAPSLAPLNCRYSLAPPARNAPGGGGRLKLGVGTEVARTRRASVQGWIRAGLAAGWTVGGACGVRQRVPVGVISLRGGDVELAARAEFGGPFLELSSRGSIFRYAFGPNEAGGLNVTVGFLLGAGGALGYSFETWAGRPEVRVGLDMVGLLGNWYGLGTATGVMPRVTFAWQL